MLMRSVKDSAEGVGVNPKDKKDRQTESGDLLFNKLCGGLR
jgi:hypothetical protein